MSRLLLDVILAAIEPTLCWAAIIAARRSNSRHLLLPKRRRRYQRFDARFITGDLS
jgi:hypothetical protein